MDIENIEIKFNNINCLIVKSKYKFNERTCLTLIDKNDGLTLMKITLNFNEVKLEDNEIIIKSYSENVGIYECLLEAGIIGKVKRFHHLTFVKAHICELLK
jgi:hypothetical protein